METGRLGNASWIAPADFAERCPYEEGTFWVGRCPETGQSLGYIDDRHILLVSSNRAGKGTTTIINNLCLWPGSVVGVDPKGENATVTAARRGKGSKFCTGREQDVHVLDPFRVAKVDDDYRSSYNPLDEIDPNDPMAARLAGSMAAAIVVETPGVKEPFWQDSARMMVKGMILHVLSDVMYEGRRNLVTVRELIALGDVRGLERLKTLGDVPPHLDAFGLLWQGMIENKAINGIVAKIGTQLASLSQGDSKLFLSMLQSVSRETEWLDDELIQKSVERSDFKLADLKDNAGGASIYLCMPQGDMAEYKRWIRMMLTLVVRVVEQREYAPACGHRILMVMDEFLTLDRIEPVKDAANYIAGFHLTMMFVVQGLSELEQKYGKGWETIVTNCGLKMAFSVGDNFTTEYLSKLIGDTEVRPEVITNATGESSQTGTTESTTESDTEGLSETISIAKTQSRSQTSSATHTESVTDTKGSSHGRTLGRTGTRSRTNTSGQSDANTAGSSQSQSRNSSIGWNDAESHGTNWSKGESDSEGTNESGSWSPRKLIARGVDDWTHLLRENETRSMGSNKSSGKSSSKGGSKQTTSGRSGSSCTGSTDTQNQSRTQTTSTGGSDTTAEGTSDSVSDTETESRAVGASDSVTRSDTVGESLTESEARTESTAHTRAVSSGSTESKGTSNQRTVGESVHVRRLLPPEDLARIFGRPRGGEVGFALVIVGTDHPTVVVRTPYYSDPYFGWLFDPHPDHAHPPFLIGEERFALPSSGAAEPFKVQVQPKRLPGDVVERGEVIAELIVPSLPLHRINEEHAKHADSVLPEDFGLPDPMPPNLRVQVRAETAGKVLESIAPVIGMHTEGDDFVAVEVNRRDLSLDPFLDESDILGRFANFLEARKGQEAEGLRRLERGRQEAAVRSVERHQNRLNIATQELSEERQKLAGWQEWERTHLSDAQSRGRRDYIDAEPILPPETGKMLPTVIVAVIVFARPLYFFVSLFYLNFSLTLRSSYLVFCLVTYGSNGSLLLIVCFKCFYV